jgi:hypothetical protein
MRRRIKLLGPAGLLLLAAACNQSKLVSGAKCNNGGAPIEAEPVATVDAGIPDGSQNATADGVPANAQALLDAMDVDPALQISNVSLSGKPNQAAAFQGLGTIAPSKGSSFAFLSTGVAGATTTKSLDVSETILEPGMNMAYPTDTTGLLTGDHCPGDSATNDCVELTFSFVAPSDAQSIAFNFNFMSAEYPEFVGLGFNDSFVVKMSSPSHTSANIVYDSSQHPINIDNVLFTQRCTALSGTGFQITKPGNGQPDNCDAGATGLLTTQAPVTPGETVTMTFRVYDATDAIYDSAVMIDNFHTSAQPVATPNTGTPTPTPSDTPAPTPTPCE